MRLARGGMALTGGGGGGVVPRGHPGLWRTPTPYLFTGLAVMMGLIVVALLVLVCRCRKPGSGSSRRGSNGAEEASVRVLVPLDREPKVVVIMAGDDAPSFLASAKPLAFAPAAPGAGDAGKVDAA